MSSLDQGLMRASRPDYGGIEVNTRNVTIVIPESGPPTYAFTCWRCDNVVVERIHVEILAKLVEHIEPVYVGRIPELEEEHTGPPLGVPDVLAFNMKLYGERA